MENTMEEIKALGTKIVNHWALTDTRQLGLQACTLAAQLFGENESLKAKLQKVERERDAAVKDMDNILGLLPDEICHEYCTNAHEDCVCDCKFVWRGLKNTTCETEAQHE